MIKRSKWLTGAGTVAALLVTTLTEVSVVCAQAPGSPIQQPRDLGASVVSTIIFALLGIVLAIIGFKLFDIAVKFDFETEICEKQNLAVAVLCGFMVLGICIIIAATVLS
jgi:hypothetical protein